MIYVFICILILFIALTLIFIESYREIKEFDITKYDIVNKKLPKEFNGYKIIMMADLHNTFYNCENIIQVIKEEKPNVVILAGDMLVYKENQRENNIQTLNFIKEISKYSDVYYAPGNHEMGYMCKNNSEWLEYEKTLLENPSDNIYYLDNKLVELTRNDSIIKIGGLYLTDGFYKRFIKKKLDIDSLNTMLGECNINELNILVAHNPDYFSDYCNWGADVILSGHNHGGLIRLPFLGGLISPRLRLFPKYYCGKYDMNDSTMILTSGLGSHSLKIRVNNTPELVLINLYSK